MKKQIAAVLGATASGKSALALALAKICGGEIVSCDSMQIYRGMDIGTAKPTPEELRTVPHHLIDVADVRDDFSAGDFAALAAAAVDGIISRGALPIFCGGTFLYLDALTEVSSLSDSSKDEALRTELSGYAAEHGAAALHEMLREIDPGSAEAIHENNVKRVIRAIEIFRTTGIRKSEWDERSKVVEAPYEVHRLIISYHSRELLYRRIDRRVDIMMDEGLEAEARRLFDDGALEGDLISSQAIGYKEFVPYFKGESTLDDAVEKIKQSSRNYAKRQLTWLKRYRDAAVIWGDDPAGVERTKDEITEDALAELIRRGTIKKENGGSGWNGNGQGGRIGKMLAERVSEIGGVQITVVGTNSMATSAMMKSGILRGATGENPVVVLSAEADVIAGPVGIIMANSMLGEITEKMAAAVASSRAEKVLIPISKCSVAVAGVKEMSLAALIDDAAEKISNIVKEA